MSGLRLVEMEVENFRGVAEAKLLPLDADVVIVSGGNGTGKTTLTDALRWVLTGELPGLAGRLKGERKGEDYVVSRYGTGPARVRLRAHVQGGVYDIERRGNASNSDVRVAPAGSAEADEPPGLASLFGFDRGAELSTAVHAWGILRQDSMRATLEEGSEALHRRLREILGLGALAEFEAAARETAQALSRQADLAREDLDKVVIELATARTELQAANLQEASRGADSAAARDRLSRIADPIAGVRVRLTEAATSSDVSAVGTQTSRLHSVALDLLQQLAGFPVAESGPDLAGIDALRRDLATASAEFENLVARRDAQQRLVTAALELLGAHCPVCAQEIDESGVREDLSRRLDDDDAASVDEIRRRVSLLRSDLDMAEANSRRREALAAARESALEGWRIALDAASGLEVPSDWRDATEFEPIAAALQEVRDALRATYRPLVALERDPAVATATARVGELEQREAATRVRAEDAARRARDADALRRAATDSGVEITERSLEALEPAFAEVYDRLAPHPSFTDLRMFHEVYYGKGRSAPRIVDPVRGIEANPSLVCSEGQLNVVALSYFLALNLETERGGLPFAALDDPLQAMDVINVLGFCDVARALRVRRQLIVTTHDRRFAALMERKLSPRELGHRTIHLRFTSWDRSGPHVEVSEPPFESIPPLLKAA